MSASKANGPATPTWLIAIRQGRSKAFLSNGMDQQEADDKHHRAGYAMNGERFRLRPARPRMIDMSPRGMMASTSRAIPTNRQSAVSITVSTTNPATTSEFL